MKILTSHLHLTLSYTLRQLTPEVSPGTQHRFHRVILNKASLSEGSQGEFIVYQLSVVPRRRHPHFQTWISLKSCGQSCSNFMCSKLGWGKGCIRFWGRLDPNSGFHGNRKPPLACNGENDVSTFSRLFLIQSFLYLQVTRTYIKSRDEFKFQPDRATDYGVSCS